MKHAIRGLSTHDTGGVSTVSTAAGPETEVLHRTHFPGDSSRHSWRQFIPWASRTVSAIAASTEPANRNNLIPIRQSFASSALWAYAHNMSSSSRATLILQPEEPRQEGDLHTRVTPIADVKRAEMPKRLGSNDYGDV